MTQLSDLPDEILYEIFRSFSIEEIVRTCILSRRWEHFWKSTTNVCFDEWVIISNSDSLHTVYGRRNPSVPVQILSLPYFGVDDRSAQRIQHFLRSTTLATQDINIAFQVNCKEQLPFTVPASIFCSETLVQLKIHVSNSAKTILELSESFYLPRLKLLLLQHLRVPNMERLLNSCPLLEKLDIKNFLTRSNENVAITICNPNLKKVTFNYTTPPLHLHNCDNLEEFYFGGYLDHELVVTGRRPKNLQSVTMYLGRGSTLIHALKLLNCLSTTKKLGIHGGRCFRFQALRTLAVEALLDLPRFDNLVELGLYGFDMEPLLDTMLNKAPCVQFLKLQEFNWIVTPPPFSFPPFLHNQLKQIRISFKILKQSELVQKLLQIGQVLEEVVIHILDTNQWKRDNSVYPNTMLERVRELPKVSENCRISLSFD